MSIQSYIELSWHDERLSWNPQDFNGAVLVFAAIDEIWVPELNLYNSQVFLFHFQSSRISNLISDIPWKAWTLAYPQIAG